MSREATSFEAKVSTISLDENGIEWVQISYYAPVAPEQVDDGAGSQVMAPSEHCMAYIRASRLPGVKLGDKVQIAFYLK